MLLVSFWSLAKSMGAKTLGFQESSGLGCSGPTFSPSTYRRPASTYKSSRFTSQTPFPNAFFLRYSKARAFRC